MYPAILDVCMNWAVATSPKSDRLKRRRSERVAPSGGPLPDSLGRPSTHAPDIDSSPTGLRFTSSFLT